MKSVGISITPEAPVATYRQIYNRRTEDGSLLARLEVAVVKYAIYLRELGGSATAEQQAWWPAALANPVSKVHAMAWEVTLDPVVSNAETTDGIADSALQTAVEYCAVKY
jgi:hypothetical protein